MVRMPDPFTATGQDLEQAQWPDFLLLGAVACHSGSKHRGESPENMGSYLGARKTLPHIARERLSPKLSTAPNPTSSKSRRS